jgi:cyclase
MKKNLAIGAAVSAAVLSMALTAGQQEYPPKDGMLHSQERGPMSGHEYLEAKKVKNDVYVLVGGKTVTGALASNTIIFIQSNGVTVIDTKDVGVGKLIIDKVKELTPKPIVRIINQHGHPTLGDHVAGNPEFPANIEIVAHENTLANMKQAPASTVYGPNPFVNGRGLPNKTFTDKLTIGSGSDQIDLYYFGVAHSNGDSWIVLPKERILITGDMFPGKVLPPYSPAGNPAVYADTLTKGYDALKDKVDIVLPGHSLQLTMKDLHEFIDFNREFVQTVSAAKAAGKSADETSSEWKIPTKFTGYFAPAPARVKGNVQAVYAQVK